jgi:hypothetical protein
MDCISDAANLPAIADHVTQHARSHQTFCKRMLGIASLR